MYKLCLGFICMQFNVTVHDVYHCCSKKLFTGMPGKKELTTYSLRVFNKNLNSTDFLNYQE